MTEPRDEARDVLAEAWSNFTTALGLAVLVGRFDWLSIIEKHRPIINAAALRGTCRPPPRRPEPEAGMTDELRAALGLRNRLGPFPNELDAVRSLHRRQDVGTPDDHVDVICVTCYILDEGWPCTVARLVEVIDAQLASEERAALHPADPSRREP